MDRFSAARERVEVVKSELLSGYPPCIECRYFEIHCTHPAASEYKLSPITGKAKAKHFDAEKIRAEDGVCGPEGALFDSRSLPGVLFMQAMTSKWTWWAAAFVAAVGLDQLLS